MNQKRIGDAEYTGAVKSTDGCFEITVNGVVVVLEPIAPSIFSSNVNGRRMTAAVTKLRDRTVVEIDSFVIEVFDADANVRRGDDHHGAKDKVTAPMPGKVVKVLVKAGDVVTLRQQLLIVEAMKMENPVVAPAAGTIKAIHVAAGDQVDTERVLVELEIATSA